MKKLKATKNQNPKLIPNPTSQKIFLKVVNNDLPCTQLMKDLDHFLLRAEIKIWLTCRWNWSLIGNSRTSWVCWPMKNRRQKGTNFSARSFLGSKVSPWLFTFSFRTTKRRLGAWNTTRTKEPLWRINQWWIVIKLPSNWAFTILASQTWTQSWYQCLISCVSSCSFPTKSSKLPGDKPLEELGLKTLLSSWSR